MVFSLGLCALLLGSKLLVDEAIKICRRYQLSPFYIGSFLIGIGTSVPELCISTVGVYYQSTDIAIGNVLGSYLGNLGLVLGTTAIIKPVLVSQNVIEKEIPLLLIALAFTVLLMVDGKLSSLDGWILLSLFFLFCTTSYFLNPQQQTNKLDEVKTPPPSLAQIIIHTAIIITSIAIIILGSYWMIQTAQVIAKKLEINDFLVGLTIIAIGTSLPELCTAIFCQVKQQNDLCLGNIIGSNIFCLLGILPIPAIFDPQSIATEKLWPELISMIVITSIFWLFAAQFNTPKKISRLEGSGLLTLYIIYIVMTCNLDG